MNDIMRRATDYINMIGEGNGVDSLILDMANEIERLTNERGFAVAAHDGQVQDKDYLAGEVVRLRAALEEIAHHLIDSKLASREKRKMAREALTRR